MSKETTVCITGASGFIASHIIKQLLEQGYKVKGTVRGDISKYTYLDELPGANVLLELVQADLLTEGSFDEIIEGCDYVLHTASPYFVNVKDPQTELVDPAVKGTLNVLAACAKAKSVKRVVLTSSMAAITDEPNNNKVFTEEDWNTLSSLKRNPYYYSKVQAEKSAWDFVKSNNTDYDLVVINPFVVIGPSLGPGLNESNKIFKDMLSGGYPTVMSINWGLVDVRDVAKSHILAMETTSASGRYLVSNEAMEMKDVVSFLKNNGFNKYRLPLVNLASPVGDKIMKILSYTQPKGSATYLRSHLSKKMQYNNSKVKRDLGLEFVTAKDSIIDTLDDLIKWKHLPDKRNK